MQLRTWSKVDVTEPAASRMMMCSCLTQEHFYAVEPSLAHKPFEQATNAKSWWKPRVGVCVCVFSFDASAGMVPAPAWRIAIFKGLVTAGHVISIGVMGCKPARSLCTNRRKSPSRIAAGPCGVISSAGWLAPWALSCSQPTNGELWTIPER